MKANIYIYQLRDGRYVMTIVTENQIATSMEIPRIKALELQKKHNIEIEEFNY